jgi:hypothetical protein
MQMLPTYRRRDELRKRITDIHIRIRYVEVEIRSYNEKFSGRKPKKLVDELAKLTEEKIELKEELEAIREELCTSGEPAEEIKVYLQGCPMEDCRGLINCEYECEVCSQRVCEKCRRSLTEKKHRCDSKDVASVRNIEKTTKSCPTCHTPVYRIDGCDQMFCVKCHTAFSWATGRVERGIIHNPHYFEWQRSQSSNGEIPRTPGDEICDEIPEYELLRWLGHLDDDHSHLLGHIYGFIDNEMVERLLSQIMYQEDFLNEDRYLFVTQKITLKEWGTRVRQTTGRIQIYKIHSKIYESLSLVLEEILNRYLTDLNDEKSKRRRKSISERFFLKLEKTRVFFNEIFLQEGRTHCFRSEEIDFISPDWIRVTYHWFLEQAQESKE